MVPTIFFVMPLHMSNTDPDILQSFIPAFILCRGLVGTVLIINKHFKGMPILAGFASQVPKSLDIALFETWLFDY